MQNNKIKINQQLMWILIIASLALSLIGTYLNIQKIDYPRFIFHFAWGVFFVVWLILLLEMISTKLYNKTFWLISMFILPHLTVLFYMIQRQRLMRLAQKFDPFRPEQ